MLCKKGSNCLLVFVMHTRLKLKRGEGKLVESRVAGARGRRERFPKSSTLEHPQVEVDSSVSMPQEGEPIMIED